MLRLSPTSPSPSDVLAPSAGAEAAAKAAFHLRLRARGVRDLAVLRAFELVPRALFFPSAYAALAARDLPLPLPCGQTSHEPWLSALAVEALGVAHGARVLEIGSGSGYVTAVLTQLTGDVIGLERFATLAAAAQDRLRALDLAHATVTWGDGLAIPPEIGTFDRILVHGCLSDIPPVFRARLAPGGRIVAGHLDCNGGRALTLWRDQQPPETICECRLASIVPGMSAAL